MYEGYWMLQLENLFCSFLTKQYKLVNSVGQDKCIGQFVSPHTKNIEIVLIASNELNGCLNGYKFKLQKVLNIGEYNDWI